MLEKISDWWRNATRGKRLEPNPARMIIVDEIPLYPDENSQLQYLDEPTTVPLKEEFAMMRHVAMQNFGSVQNLLDTLKRQTTKGIEQSRELSKKLNEDYGTLPKAAAITVGGLAGFLFGMKRSITRRFIYSGVGLLAMATVCYPFETTHIAREGLIYAQKAWNDFAQSPQPPEYPPVAKKSIKSE